jgi:formylglycine-generating enzyme required for sulfatase activity
MRGAPRVAVTILMLLLAVAGGAAARPDAPLTLAEEQSLKPQDSFKECPQCPEMVVMPAGSFAMGSSAAEEGRLSNEGPQHQTTIRVPFAAGRFAVTRGEFAAFVADTGHKIDGGCSTLTGSDWTQQADRDWRSPGFLQNDRHPVVCVSWNDAKAYAAWLSARAGKAYRLLTEAEREYVTRAGTTTPFWWGSSTSAGRANYYRGNSQQQTVEVDTFTANPWGLHQVHGNVWEWTEDCWNAGFEGAPTDSSARTSGDCRYRVVRGGSWYMPLLVLRSASRNRNQVVSRDSTVGFRVARTLAP